MIFSDEDCQKAYDVLKATENEHAQKKADHDALKKHENALIATLKTASSEKTSAAKEDEAYASPEYAVWEAGMKAATFELTKLENRRDRMQTLIDIWRTSSANSRRL